MRVACVLFDRPAPTSKLAELFIRFSPQITLRKDRAIFIEIGGCRNLYSEQSFELRARILMRKVGYEPRIVVADSIPSAIAYALFQKDGIDDIPLEGLQELTDPFDRDLALRKGVAELIDVFQDTGIRNLGQFKALPIHALISRFGVLGRYCHLRAWDRDFVAWPKWEPEEVIRERREFPYFEFYGELDPILFELKNQLDQVFMRVRGRQRKVTKLQVTVECEKISTHANPIRTLTFDFFSPQSATKGTLRVLKERLMREFEKRPILSPIEAIETTVLRTVLGHEEQSNMLSNEAERMEEVYSFHNQLIEIVGPENVFHAELTEDRRPEKSWVKSFRLPHSESSGVVDLANEIPERATYQLRRPVRIEITAGFVHINGKRQRILHWDDDVERINGGWYEKESEVISDKFDRNYYHVVVEGHQRLTVFETPNREFYLHGFYG